MPKSNFAAGLSKFGKKDSKSVSNTIDIVKSKKVPFVRNLFNQYQLDIINDPSDLVVVEKSRRIGASFSLSYMAVREAMADRNNTYYSTYNFIATQNFIKNCGKWCKAFNHLFKIVYKMEIIDESKIVTYSINFPNGKVIEAISSNAVNLRDKEGIIILDEAAFRDKAESSSLNNLLKAGIAITMRGGKIFVLSTHFGINSEFNQLCREVENGDRPGSLHTITFKDAIAQGMYRSMCLIKGEEYTKEKEIEWEQKIRHLYRHSAEEELDVIPSSNQGNLLFKKDDFDFVDIPDNQLTYCLKLVSFDLASSSQEKADQKTYKPYYTAYVKIILFENLLIIYDAEAHLFGAQEGDLFMENVIRMTDNFTTALVESEPGSEKYDGYFKERINTNVGKDVEFYKPVKSKVLRALPLVPLIRSREETEFRIVIHERLRNRDIVNKDKARITDATYTGIITGFDGTPKPLVNDLTDSTSNGIDWILSKWLRSI